MLRTMSRMPKVLKTANKLKHPDVNSLANTHALSGLRGYKSTNTNHFRSPWQGWHPTTIWHCQDDMEAMEEWEKAQIKREKLAEKAARAGLATLVVGAGLGLFCAQPLHNEEKRLQENSEKNIQSFKSATLYQK